MHEADLAALWKRLDKAGVLTGAWTGISFEDLPIEVRIKFARAVVPSGTVFIGDGKVLLEHSREPR